MKLILFALFFGLGVCNTITEENKMYALVINDLYRKSVYNFVIVNDSTSTNIFNTISINKPEELFQRPNTIANKNEWFSILRSINQLPIKAKPISENFPKTVKVKLKTQVLAYYKEISSSHFNKRKPNEFYGLVTFTSIIKSLDGKKAICGVNIYEDKDSEYKMLYFFQRKKDSWVVVGNLLISFS